MAPLGLGGGAGYQRLGVYAGLSGHPEYKFPKEAKNLRNAIVRDGHSFDLNYKRYSQPKRQLSELEERTAIFVAFERVLCLLCFGKPASEDDEPLGLAFSFFCGVGGICSELAEHRRGTGRDVVLIREGFPVKRRSPMIN